MWRDSNWKILKHRTYRRTDIPKYLVYSRFIKWDSKIPKLLFNWIPLEILRYLTKYQTHGLQDLWSKPQENLSITVTKQTPNSTLKTDEPDIHKDWQRLTKLSSTGGEAALHLTRSWYNYIYKRDISPKGSPRRRRQLTCGVESTQRRKKKKERKKREREEPHKETDTGSLVQRVRVTSPTEVVGRRLTWSRTTVARGPSFFPLDSSFFLRLSFSLATAGEREKERRKGPAGETNGRRPPSVNPRAPTPFRLLGHLKNIGLDLILIESLPPGILHTNNLAFLFWLPFCLSQRDHRFFPWTVLFRPRWFLFPVRVYTHAACRVIPGLLANPMDNLALRTIWDHLDRTFSSSGDFVPRSINILFRNLSTVFEV